MKLFMIIRANFLLFHQFAHWGATREREEKVECFPDPPAMTMCFFWSQSNWDERVRIDRAEFLYKNISIRAPRGHAEKECEPFPRMPSEFDPWSTQPLLTIGHAPALNHNMRLFHLSIQQGPPILSKGVMRWAHQLICSSGVVLQ